MTEECVTEELDYVRKNLESEVEGVDLIACHPRLVSFKVKRTKHKELTTCLQFPENYPQDILFIELKSKVLSPVVLSSVGKICDQELKKHVGMKQVLIIARFIRKFLDESPLLPCRDELTQAKKEILEDDIDVLKLKQKQGVIIVNSKKNNYHFKFSVSVPDDYPVSNVEMKIESNNFPASMAYYFISQAREFARQAVEPPLRKTKNAAEFVPSPHVFKVIKFIVKDCVKNYPVQRCPICQDGCLPHDTTEIITDPTNDNYVERMYCGHVYHHGCLDKYMKTPPFEGGKKCPNCGIRIYHDKWNISPKLAEERWSHQQARQRELDEVVEFLS